MPAAAVERTGAAETVSIAAPDAGNEIGTTLDALRGDGRSTTPGGFVPLPKRWVVERTFAWLGRYRRLSKDYEYHTHNSETMIYLAMISLMLRRLAPR